MKQLDYVEKRQSKMHHAHEVAQKHLQSAASQQKDQYEISPVHLYMEILSGTKLKFDS